MADTEKIIEIQVLRYRSEQDKEPVLQSFKVPFTDDMSVLQGLQYIKDFLDGTLSFRWSCRMAICGSCGMMIDGKPKLSCKTFLREYYPQGLRVEALAHMPIERDLMVSVEDFVTKLESIKPYIIPKEPRTLEQGEYLQTPAQLEQFLQFSGAGLWLDHFVVLRLPHAVPHWTEYPPISGCGRAANRIFATIWMLTATPPMRCALWRHHTTKRQTLSRKL